MATMKRADRGILIVVGGLLLAGGLALMALVSVALRTGRLDARPKHSVLPDPAWMSAGQEPVWFYGTVVLLALLAAYVIVLSWRMMREAWRGDSL